MRGDSFSFTGALQHEELGEDGDALREYGKRPEDLGEGELVVEDKG